ncbi:MAG: NRDE family protein [Alphaproteobacteria bacterium]
MCSVIILRRPSHSWPILVAANRDEMLDRPTKGPARHWPDRSNVVAGQDELAGGTWLGVNDEGVVAGVMNRRGSLGPAAGVRSRGELVLEALDHADAKDAAEALAHLDARAYRAFNLFVADNRDAYWLKGLGREGPAVVQLFELPPGLSMLTAYDRNDISSGRIGTYLPRFERASAPDPETGDWAAWQALLASREIADGGGEDGAMTIVTERGFGTVSSSLIALPAAGAERRRTIWLYAAGRPDRARYEPVALVD